MFEHEGITFDDLLLIPRYSEVLPSEVDTSTRICKGIELNIPLISSAMDTVTEADMAIGLAQLGGIGIIHKNMKPERQAREVFKVKRSESGVIKNPITLTPEQRVQEAASIMDSQNISGIPIVDENEVVQGILTERDLQYISDTDRKVKEVMTKENLVTASPETTLEEAKDILYSEKVEKLLLVNDDFQLTGLITIKDIKKTKKYPDSTKDDRGRLRAGAAIGVHDYDRARKLLDNDVDLLVVDSAHGHSKNVIETVEELTSSIDTPIIAGNVATTAGAEDLIDAGAGGIKVGIGPGSICTTRVIAGVGIPQVTAIQQASEVCKERNIPLIADGGIRHSGDITKAIAVGADSVMIGSLFAGVDESPGERILYKGRTYKVYRGMGSEGAMSEESRDRYQQQDIEEDDKLVPEGVEGRVPYKGALSDVAYQLVGGLRSGMGYCGSDSFDELREKAKFVRSSEASQKESHPHDIQITREAPNYSPKSDEE